MQTSSLHHKPSDFRLLLQQELVRRCKANESYSLRAFARSLKISSSALSAILNGKRPLTEKTMLRLGGALGLSATDLVSFQSKKKNRAEDEDARQLTLDTFACISDWYHFPLLELTRVTGFHSDAAWVARKLGLTRTQVNIAVERLQRLGLLEIDHEGIWRDTSAEVHLTNISENLTSTAAIMLQQQLLELAMKALRELPIEVRDHTSMTIGIDPQDIPLAKKKIKKFRRELADFFERRGTPQHIYQFSCALFPVTKIES